jgi:hypothetical protein
MPMNIATSFTNTYDRLENAWHSLQKTKLISNIVILFFIAGIGISLLSHHHIISTKVGKFFAIELAFTVLLLIEVFDLFFIITHSVADSICKQFEIISLILLRSAFKELGHLPLSINWDAQSANAMMPIIADALGAVVIFFITIVFTTKQKHVQITKTEAERLKFILQKKIIATLMILFFITEMLYSIFLFATQKIINEALFSQLYTALIFSDIFILILSLRYSSLYVHLFRYSSFALATVILRLSLSAPAYINVVLSICAGLFILIITEAYNYFTKKQVDLID